MESLQRYSEGNVEMKGSDMESKKVEKKKKKRRSRRSAILKKLSCFRSSDYDYPTIDEVDGAGNVDMESATADKDHSPTHLVVMVNGIIGSADNWRFAAKQFLKKYPQDIHVHCSECNVSLLTLDGVDVMGNRLADEVISVIQRHPNLLKISFIGHSLGGLIARYAIAKLYRQDSRESASLQNGECGSDVADDQCSGHISRGKIAGLEPVNFITVATPHLGTRGHRQVPMFYGFNSVEKLASHISWVLGRTGRHLFLTDKAHGQPPLLLQMVNDCEDLKFLSALQSFKRRVVYANAHFDHVVGWSTSSIRRRNELPKRKHLSRSSRYPHILKEDATKATKQEGSMESQANTSKTARAASDTMEETMIKGLSKVSWERIDVSFKGSKQRYFAHNTIQVKSPWMNSDGADVIQHMVDHFLL